MKIQKKKIGREDVIDFPGFDLTGIRVRIDTGAFTSAIHCKTVTEVEKEGETHLEFQLFDENSPEVNSVIHTTSDYEKRKIKNTSGIAQERFVVKTTVRIFDELEEIEISLADRGNMNFPVLLGRRFINHRYIVDSTKVNLSFKKSTL